MVVVAPHNSQARREKSCLLLWHFWYRNMPSGRKRVFASRPSIASLGVSSKRPQRPTDNPHGHPRQHFVCHVCHFHALDASGLLQHASVSTHCSQTFNSNSSILAGIENVDEPQFPPMDINSDNDFDNDGFLDESSSRDGELLRDGNDGDGGEEAMPDMVVRARALSHMTNWSCSSDEEASDEADDDEEEQEAATKNNDKYEYYEEKDFPASPDDNAHVLLADLCRRLRTPLYGYDKILRWAQEAHLSGYTSQL